MKFELQAKYQPTGDQPQAIEQLTAGVEAGKKNQVLLGVTGSGKTFTIANVIARTQRPTLVIAHNKTLAAQLYQELRDFSQKCGLLFCFLLTIISLKPTYLAVTLTSKKRQ